MEVETTPDSVIKTLKNELEMGGDPNSKDQSTGLSLMHNFVAIQRLDAIELLLLNGADINLVCHPFGPPLFYALSINAPSSVQYLIEKGANINLALGFAISCGDIKQVKRLLKLGADIHNEDYDEQTPFQLALQSPQKDIVPLLLEEAQSRISKLHSSFKKQQKEIKNLKNQMQKSNLAAREMLLYKQEVEKYVGLWGLERNKNILLTNRLNQLERQISDYSTYNTQPNVIEIKQESNRQILEDLHLDIETVSIIEEKAKLESEIRSVNSILSEIDKEKSSREMQQLKLLLQLKKIQNSLCANCEENKTSKTLKCGHYYCESCESKITEENYQCRRCKESITELSHSLLDPITLSIQVGVGSNPI